MSSCNCRVSKLALDLHRSNEQLKTMIRSYEHKIKELESENKTYNELLKYDLKGLHSTLDIFLNISEEDKTLLQKLLASQQPPAATCENIPSSKLV